MLIKVGIFLFVLAFAAGSAIKIGYLPKIHPKHSTTTPPGLLESTTGHETPQRIPNRKIRSPDDVSKATLKTHIKIDHNLLHKHSTKKRSPVQDKSIELQQKHIPKIPSLDRPSGSGIKIAPLPKVNLKHSTTNLPLIELQQKHIPIRKARSLDEESNGVLESHVKIVQLPKISSKYHEKHSSTNLPPVEVEWIEPQQKHTPIRKVRSPGKGSTGINISHNDKSGTTGSINAQHNIFSSSDGKTKVDAFGSVSKNFDHGNSNQNIGLSLNDGSAGININHNDKSGTSGTISANQNIYSSPDGKTKVDVSAGVSKNFDHGNSDKNIGLSVSHEI